jgi:hypothetical protein
VHDRLSDQIAALPTLNKAQLLAIWAENFSKDPPPNLRKELMVPILAFRIQEKAYGGLSYKTRRRLREIAQSLDTIPRKRKSTRTQPGTRLVRSWKGVLHQVTVLSSGYEYNGRSYDSLSVIARVITGTRWSGPLFFGTKRKAA